MYRVSSSIDSHYDVLLQNPIQSQNPDIHTNIGDYMMGKKKDGIAKLCSAYCLYYISLDILLAVQYIITCSCRWTAVGKLFNGVSSE